MGQFSWFTQDTDMQIGSEPENTITVYMFDDKGNRWKEENYEGYGEFGGKDFYDLVAEMNGFNKDNVDVELREKGIELYYDKDWDRKGYLSPALMESSSIRYTHDFREKPKDDPNQSWYEYAKGGMTFDLTPSDRKSFYGKAKVITKGGINYLQSYSTIVAEYNPTTKKMKIYDYYSPTTARHINAFLNYYGYPSMSKSEIMANKNKSFARGGMPDYGLVKQTRLTYTPSEYGNKVISVVEDIGIDYDDDPDYDERTDGGSIIFPQGIDDEDVKEISSRLSEKGVGQYWFNKDLVDDSIIIDGVEQLGDGHYARGGKVKKKQNNEMLIGGIAGVLLGIFLNR